MAHHAFNFVTYDEATSTLTVEGTSNRDLGTQEVTILVAVIDVHNEERRCEPVVGPTRVALETWYATIVGGPFLVGDDVFTVGMARSKAQPDIFLWAEKFTIRKA